MTLTMEENDCESQSQQPKRKSTMTGYVSETGGVVVASGSNLQDDDDHDDDEDQEVIYFDAAERSPEQRPTSSFPSGRRKGVNGSNVSFDDKIAWKDSDGHTSSLISPNDSPNPLDADYLVDSDLDGSESIRTGMKKKKRDRYSKVFGENYNKKEANFVLIAAIILSLNSGFMNGATMSGLLTDGYGRAVGVSGLTGAWTRSGLDFGSGDWSEYGFQTSLVLSYMFGSFLTGVITPNGKTYHIEPTYGPTMLLGGVLLVISSILAWYESEDPHFTFYFAAASNGIQNGIASIYSAKLIRCTMTGVSVDIALTFGQMVRGNKENKWKGVVLGLVSFNFWLGGVLSIFATRRFRHFTLFLSAGLFLLVGFALVWWLVVEMDMSIYAAVFGTWEWEETLLQLQESIREQQQNGGGNNSNGITLDHDAYMDWFDIIDQDGSGTVGTDELLEAFQKANIKMKLRDVKLLVKTADTSGDGLIDRDEWKVVIDKLFEKSSSSRGSFNRSKSQRWSKSQRFGSINDDQ